MLTNRLKASCSHNVEPRWEALYFAQHWGQVLVAKICVGVKIKTTTEKWLKCFIVALFLLRVNRFSWMIVSTFAM